MNRPILLLLLGLAAACSTADAPPDRGDAQGAVAESPPRPELRYYVIADT